MRSCSEDTCHEGHLLLSSRRLQASLVFCSSFRLLSLLGMGRLSFPFTFSRPSSLFLFTYIFEEENNFIIGTFPILNLFLFLEEEFHIAQAGLEFSRPIPTSSIAPSLVSFPVTYKIERREKLSGPFSLSYLT